MELPAAAAARPPLLFRPGKAGFLLRALLIGVVMAGFVTAFKRGQAWFRSESLSAPLDAPVILPLPPAAALPSDEIATEEAIRSFTARARHDPEDARSQNALAALYLQRVRDTGREDYLLPALEAARASVASVAPERNLGGLTVLAHAEFANHNFAAARDHARRLVALQPRDAEPYAILGEALMELGNYAAAREAFAQMEQFGRNTVTVETRLARWSFLQGQTDQAREHLTRALLRLLESPQPPRETVAWCRWQLGEIAFSTGDYRTAKKHYDDALVTAPDYFRALASAGRQRATQRDWAAAINFYERAVRLNPAPEFVAALADLYQLSGRSAETGVRIELVEQLADHSRTVHGQPYNRQLALFYADHGLKTEAAYALAKSEYEVRRDIYGADALAWAALKAGRVAEAKAASEDALRLGTNDAKLFYHAGLIAKAGGDRAKAQEFLKRALTLNPQFDPLQASFAREALEH